MSCLRMLHPHQTALIPARSTQGSGSPLKENALSVRKLLSQEKKRLYGVRPRVAKISTGNALSNGRQANQVKMSNAYTGELQDVSIARKSSH